MTVPRILILDDVTGWSLADRQAMCSDLALLDITDGDIPRDKHYLAEAVFHPGQTRRGDEIVNDVDAALDVIARGWDGSPGKRWALVLLDLQFDHGPISTGEIDPDRNWPQRADREFGLQILEEMARRWPDEEVKGFTAIPVGALSIRPRADLEEALGNLGVKEYIERGQMTAREQRRELVELILCRALLPDDDLPALDDNDNPEPIRREPRILGQSIALLRALRKARNAARSDAPCLLLGPPGVGKEQFARYIHALSGRGTGPLEAVNCAAIPDALIESELFGHEKGSFTGAVNAKLGRFELAGEGSIFLDEIGDMGISAQTKVLRVLQEGIIQRVGGTRSIAANARVIAATNKDLHAAVRTAQFREDLLGRLGGIENGISIPPLRDRIGDLEILFDHFVTRETVNLGGRQKRTIHPDVYFRLERRDWSANNVRELENLAKRIASERRNSEVIVGADVPEGYGGFRKVTEEAPSVTTTQVRTYTLQEVIGTLEKALIPVSPRELSGVLPLVQNAHGLLLQRLLSASLDATRDPTRTQRHAVLGDLLPTPAVRLLLGTSSLSASEAASILIRLSRLFPSEPDSSSDIGRALQWAKGLRQGRGHRRRRGEDEDLE